MYREDLVKLKEQIQAQQHEEEEEDPKKPKRKGIKASSTQGKKNEAPTSSLTLEFVHG